MYKPKTIREWFEHRYGYLRYKTNGHKHPWLSKALCAIGRHDLMVEDVVFDSGRALVRLQCFYCEGESLQIKTSSEIWGDWKKIKGALGRASGYIETTARAMARGSYDPRGNRTRDVQELQELAEELKKLSEEI